ncbi:Palmitoyltransferase pfa5 [Penicillium lividum]|nr:Palmitoyltransferase pfa5 [Penicillium lividum]
MATRAQKRVNLAVSKVIPPLLVGFMIYASYAVTKPICIDYLIHPLPSYNRNSRVGAGAAIIVVYYLLLIFMLGTYLRLLYNVICKPGYLPLGAERLQADAAAQESNKGFGWWSSKPQQTEKADEASDLEQGVNNDAAQGGQADTLGLENFYRKDVFVCQDDGRPQYCSTCCQYKTDRAHHCREIDRCVAKMDHFCPWVGGVVSETTFKFFIQFVGYTAIFCIFVLIVSAYFVAEVRRNLLTFFDQTGSVNPHWCVCLGLAAFFGFFTGVMTLSSLQMAMVNVTTIENLSRHSHVWILAIRVPEHLLDRLWVSESAWAPTFRMVSYPSQGATLPSPSPPQPTDSTAERHVFAILHTEPGENPFDLGYWNNLQQVMGYSLTDWLLPLKPSPCADHTSQESAFALGPVVTRLKQEAGLLPSLESQPQPNNQGT